MRWISWAWGAALAALVLTSSQSASAQYYGPPGSMPPYPRGGPYPPPGGWTTPPTYNPPPQQREPSRNRSSLSPLHGIVDLGLLGAGTHIDTMGSQSTTYSGGLTVQLMMHTLSPSGSTARAMLGASLSGGEQGLVFYMPMDVSWGFFLDIGDASSFSHGPFARLGTMFVGAGHNQFKLGFWEFPNLTAGYTMNAGEDFALELGGRAGALLIGGYSVGEDFYLRDERRRIDISGDYGAGATLTLGPLVVDATVFRAHPATSPKKQMDFGRALACIGGFGAIICGEGLFWKGDVTDYPVSTRWDSVTLGYVGLSIGIGAVGGLSASPVSVPSWLKL